MCILKVNFVLLSEYQNLGDMNQSVEKGIESIFFGLVGTSWRYFVLNQNL